MEMWFRIGFLAFVWGVSGLVFGFRDYPVVYLLIGGIFLVVVIVYARVAQAGRHRRRDAGRPD